ncbi:MAG TPA: (d)CMP kinase [Acidimicrobiales bacterium]|nr:(d)CMP kinase [Acidimicrobiales bacterium]
MRVIAIDGPAGSGKSTVARAVAARLGLDYLDTGAMYRSVTLAALRRGIAPEDTAAVAALAPDVAIELAGGAVTVDGQDATDAIRGPEVSQAVSVVAANPAVRADLVARQQAWIEEHGGGVVEGRDIGTVVFPAAELKVFLTASDTERANRRTREAAGFADESAVAENLAHRDRLDSTRAASPLKVADDAVVIDTTGRPVEEIVEEVLRKL